MTPISTEADLTTRQAAEALGVSHLYLLELLDRSALHSRMVDSSRRVPFADVLAYKQQPDAARLAALAELSALDQELGLSF